MYSVFAGSPITTYDLVDELPCFVRESQHLGFEGHSATVTVLKSGTYTPTYVYSRVEITYTVVSRQSLSGYAMEVVPFIGHNMFQLQQSRAYDLM